MIASSALRWKMGRPQTLLALIRKEVLQIARDPSALLIAFVLPVILLSLFAFAISLDVDEVRVGVVLESDGPIAGDLAGAFAGTPFLDARFGRDRREFEPMIVSGELRGMVVIPADFDRLIQKGQIDKAVQIITDGSQPNTANFTSGYLQGVFDTWLASRLNREPTVASIGIDPRFWFNPELESRRVLLPGAIAIVMTMIGTLLTALVVAREWERGTMEALMSTPASNAEILLGKLVPYFLLGLLTIVGCTGLAVFVFGLPLEGSVIALLILSAAFLLPALGQGLLISTISKNQFIASQVALMTGFLPAFLLSGFLFEIASMPGWIQWLTRVVPARYYVEGLQTVFLAGDIWSQLAVDIVALAALGALLVGITAFRTQRSLD